MGDEGKISEEEAEIEIIHRPFGRIIFEETKKEGAVDSRAHLITIY